MVQDIITLMANFQVCSIQYANRTWNGVVAHRLARYAWNVNQVKMWYVDVPDFLSQTFWFDIRLYSWLLIEMKLFFYQKNKKKWSKTKFMSAITRQFRSS